MIDDFFFLFPSVIAFSFLLVGCMGYRSQTRSHSSVLKYLVLDGLGIFFFFLLLFRFLLHVSDFEVQLSFGCGWMDHLD